MNNRRGRPAGGSNARQRLVDAAQGLFLRDGYSQTTVRRIAEHAGVDHALVNYHFGSKEGLFTAVVDLLASPGQLVGHATGTGPEHLAGRLLEALLTTWDSPSVQEHSRRLLSAIQTDPTTQEAFRGYLEHQVVAQIAGTLTGRDATARAGAAATVIAGLFLTRYVARIEPIAGMTRSEVVGHLGPALHACLAPHPRR